MPGLLANRLICVFVALFTVCLASARALSSGQESPETNLFYNVRHSVVTITTDRCLGTGVCIGATATTSYIATARHVVTDPGDDGITVTASPSDSDPKDVKAVLVNQDAVHDVAVIEIPIRLHALILKEAFGFSEIISVGTHVFVIGSPQGLGGTLSSGLLSREEQYGDRAFQFDAPVSPGSSGGPVLTLDGFVIGIVTSSLTESQNINFAADAGLLEGMIKTECRPGYKILGEWHLAREYLKNPWQPDVHQNDSFYTEPAADACPPWYPLPKRPVKAVADNPYLKGPDANPFADVPDAKHRIQLPTPEQERLFRRAFGEPFNMGDPYQCAMPVKLATLSYPLYRFLKARGFDVRSYRQDSKGHQWVRSKSSIPKRKVKNHRIS